MVPQEKLAYFREFSLVKLLKSPLNLLFDESIDGYTRRRGRKTQRKLRDSRIIRGAEQTEWKRQKERVLAEMDSSVAYLLHHVVAD